MSRPTGPGSVRSRALFALLVGLLVALALIMSGAAPALAQNAVGPQPVMSILAVGPHQAAAQTIVGVQGLLQLRHASATGVAAETGGDAAYHYTFAKYADSIAQDGLRPGSYATADGSLSPLQAQLDLALPPNRGLPEVKIRVDVAGLRDAGYAIPDVTRVSSTVTGAGGRVYTMPGGGYQMQFPYAIPGPLLKVEP